MGDDSGGILRRQDLRRNGVDDGDLRRMLEAGQLRRLRWGWYAFPHADELAARAVSLGGALACVSALRWYGVRQPLGVTLHIRRSADLLREPIPAGVKHCGAGCRLPVSSAIDSPLVAWRSAVSCLSFEDAVAVTDSALGRRILHPTHIAGSRRMRRLAGFVDPRAESWTESITRVRLQQAGMKVVPQVVIPGVGRHDLLVGDRLVVECDSKEHHTARENYQSDRRRDRQLVALGYVPLRLTWEDVMFGWDEAFASIRAVVRADAHRRRAPAVGERDVAA